MRHAAYLAQDRGVGQGVRPHVIGPLPHRAFRLVTEETDDAFDSGDEDLERTRTSRERRSGKDGKVEEKSTERTADVTDPANCLEHGRIGNAKGGSQFKRVRKVVQSHLERDSKKKKAEKKVY